MRPTIPTDKEKVTQTFSFFLSFSLKLLDMTIFLSQTGKSAFDDQE